MIDSRSALAVAALVLAGSLAVQVNAGAPTTDDAEAAVAADLDQSPDEELPLGDLSGEGRWSVLTDNLRWALDVAGRLDVNTRDGSLTHVEFVGIDLHKVVSTSKRDIGTLLIQLYGKGVDGDWKYTTRLLYFNYLASGGGGFNIRIGHILVPYGLNLPSRTPGSLRQYITGRDIGFKADWGASVNGVLPAWNYEISLTRGSGVDFKSHDSPYLVSGRVGSSFGRPLVAGLSALYGDVLGKQGVVRKARVGADVRWLGGPVDVRAEVSYGSDDRTTDVLNTFGEISWWSPEESFMAYVQGRFFMTKPANDWQETSYLTVGARIHVLRHIWLSADYRYGFTRDSRAQKPDVFRAQLRYRFF